MKEGREGGGGKGGGKRQAVKTEREKWRESGKQDKNQKQKTSEVLYKNPSVSVHCFQAKSSDSTKGLIRACWGPCLPLPAHLLPFPSTFSLYEVYFSLPLQCSLPDLEPHPLPVSPGSGIVSSGKISLTMFTMLISSPLCRVVFLCLQLHIALTSITVFHNMF